MAEFRDENTSLPIPQTSISSREVISHAVWLYHRFSMSFRDVEDLLAERGVTVSYETVRQWCTKFGHQYARRLKRRHGRLGDTWYLDELFITINGHRQYLWRAVDQDGDVIDILVQARRDGVAALRFFRQLLKSQRREPFRLVTDKLGSYRVAHRTTMPLVTHDTASRRGFASTDAATRTTDARLQVARPVSEIPARSRCDSESVPPGPPPAQVRSPPDAEGAVFQRVGGGDGSVS